MKYYPVKQNMHEGFKDTLKEKAVNLGNSIIRNLEDTEAIKEIKSGLKGIEKYGKVTAGAQVAITTLLSILVYKALKNPNREVERNIERLSRIYVVDQLGNKYPEKIINKNLRYFYGLIKSYIELKKVNKNLTADTFIKIPNKNIEKLRLFFVEEDIIKVITNFK